MEMGESVGWRAALRAGDVAAIRRLAPGRGREDLDIALRTAANEGKIEALMALLELGADPRWVEPRSETQALVPAIHGGEIECVKALLSLVDADHPDKNGQTPCMLAAMGFPAALRELLTPERARAVDDEGQTLLHWAAWGRDLECIALVAPMSDPLARAARGRTALMVAAISGSDLAPVQALAALDGADEVDSNGDDAAAIAQQAGFVKMSKFLAQVARAQKESSELARATEGAACAPKRPMSL